VDFESRARVLLEQWNLSQSSQLSQLCQAPLPGLKRSLCRASV